MPDTSTDTSMGELFRQTWQPICLAHQLADLPLAVRILGEDLVVYRDRAGRVGVLHRHCSHRGTSLEYGIVSERGLRCCYHGWLFDADGTILETPGEPPNFQAQSVFPAWRISRRRTSGPDLHLYGPVRDRTGISPTGYLRHSRGHVGALLALASLQLAAGAGELHGSHPYDLPA